MWKLVTARILKQSVTMPWGASTTWKPDGMRRRWGNALLPSLVSRHIAYIVESAALCCAKRLNEAKCVWQQQHLYHTESCLCCSRESCDYCWHYCTSSLQSSCLVLCRKFRTAASRLHGDFPVQPMLCMLNPGVNSSEEDLKIYSQAEVDEMRLAAKCDPFPLAFTKLLCNSSKSCGSEVNDARSLAHLAS